MITTTTIHLAALELYYRKLYTIRYGFTYHLGHRLHEDELRRIINGEYNIAGEEFDSNFDKILLIKTSWAERFRVDDLRLARERKLGLYFVRSFHN